MASTENRGKLMDNPVTWVVLGTLLALWGYGIFHAYTAHERMTTILSVVLPPYGIYMAATDYHGHPAEVQMGERRELSPAEVVEYCKANEEQRAQTGLTQPQYEVYCECTFEIVFETMGAYQGDEAKRDQFLNAVLNQASQNCIASARYLGEGGVDSPF